MGSQKSSESTSYSGSGQQWAKPFAKDAAKSVFNAYNQAQPTLDRAVAGTSGIAGNLANQYDQGQTQAAQARDYWSQILSGGHLNGNPQLESIIGSAAGDIRDSVGASYSGAGRYGSAMHDKAVAQQVGDMSSQLRYGDYNNQMARMDQAAQSATGANQATAGQALGGYGQMGQLPYAGMGNLSNSLAALFSGGNSKSTTYAPNPLWGALGAGLGAAGMAFSDARLKTKIELIGREPDGLGIYTWNWKSAPEGERVKGVLAHEVKELRPQAYIENYRGSGFDGVNYGAL